MWAATLPPSTPIVISIFGIQHHPQTQSNPNDESNTNPLIKPLTALLPKSTNTTHITQTTPVHTEIWLTYWPSPTTYHEWWTSDPVSSFWSSLADNAGIYREILTVPPSRTQHGTNTNTEEKMQGMAVLGEYTSVLDKSGYWGCYYDRMRDTESKEGRCTLGSRSQCQSGAGGVKMPRVHSPLGNSGDKEPTRIRIGRVKPNIPDNITFVVEGQDHTSVSGEEKVHWLRRFDSLARNWIGDLVDAGPERGILDARVCYDASSGIFSGPASAPAPAAPAAPELDSNTASNPSVTAETQPPPNPLDFNRKIQLFYFLDMESMEKIGRENTGHVRLRREFLKDYGPGGVMGELAGGSGLCLWVEVSILMGSEVECEYVGCIEGTGLGSMVDG
ncbi:hem-containing dehydratase protein [Aspergillus californicus]